VNTGSVDLVTEGTPTVAVILSAEVAPALAELKDPVDVTGEAEFIEVVNWLTEGAADAEEVDVRGARDTREPVMVYKAWQATRSIPCKLLIGAMLE
jgi:hypothetical protein